MLMDAIKKLQKQAKAKLAAAAGFTLIELIAVLVILAILAAVAVPSMISYMRTAQFRQNEEHARTIYLAAQTALASKDTGGSLPEYLATVRGAGTLSNPFTSAVANADEKNKRVYALFLSKGEYNSGSQSAQAKALLELIDRYTYEKTILDASICLEIDAATGEVYSAFYSAQAEQLTLADDLTPDARSYDARSAGDKLTGYYSAGDLVNVVQLEEQKLKVNNLRFVNGETLSLVWQGDGIPGVVYTADIYDDNTGKLKFTITIDTTAPITGDAYETKVTTYKEDGTPDKEDVAYNFPLSCDHNSYVLVLDAMVSAQVLADSTPGNPSAEAWTHDNLYSMTRFIAEPTTIRATMQASAGTLPTGAFAPSDKVNSENTANTLFGDDSDAAWTTGTTYEAKLEYFRHLYNIRWMEDKAANFALTTDLNWTGDAGAEPGSGAVVYMPTEAAPNGKSIAFYPTAAKAVAFPTVPVLGNGQTLTAQTAPASVTISNLQLRNSSVALDDATKKTGAHYLGLFGENRGSISNLTLEDVDVLVNVKNTGTAAKPVYVADTAKTTGSEAYRAYLRGVGGIAGLTTGVMKQTALTQSTGGTTGTKGTAQVIAAVNCAKAGTVYTGADNQYLVDATKAKVGDMRGIGGVAGIVRTAVTGETSQPVTFGEGVATAAKVVGILNETAPATATLTDEQQYALASFADANTSWLPGGIGGVAGFWANAAQSGTGITATGDVTGNMMTGGVVGNLLSNLPDPKNVYKGLEGSGTVHSSAAYDSATSTRAGQFFGGLVGYARGIKLQNSKGSVTGADFVLPTTPAAMAQSLQGDFFGGLVGYSSDNTFIGGNTTVGGYVLGHDFVGGIVGSFESTLSSPDSLYAYPASTGFTNTNNVLGHSYVGGITGTLTGGTTLRAHTNNGVVLGFADTADLLAGTSTAQCVGGIAGRVDGTWGGKTGSATLYGDTSAVAGDVNALATKYTALGANTTKFVGGLAGFMDSATGYDDNIGITALALGSDYVGGVAGYFGPQMTGFWQNNATVNGVVLATGDCVGGFVGMDRGQGTLQNGGVAINLSQLEGRNFVGGYVGAVATTKRDSYYSWKNTNAACPVKGNVGVGGVAGYLARYDVAAEAIDEEHLDQLLPTFSYDVNGNFKDDLTDAVATKSGTFTLLSAENAAPVQGFAYVGGLVGINSAKVQQSTNTGNVTGTVGVGGLAGVNTGTGIITQCDVKNGAAINGESCVGGGVGRNYAKGDVSIGTILANVQGTGSNVGGLVGQNLGEGIVRGGNVGDGTNAYTIKGNANVGGMVGHNLGVLCPDNVTCAVNGKVTITATTDAVGGFVGRNAGSVMTKGGSLTNNATVISGGNGAGGFIGVQENGEFATQTWCTITNNGSVSGGSSVGGVIGLMQGGTAVTATGIMKNYGVVNATGDNVGGIVGLMSGGTFGKTDGSVVCALENYASVTARGSYAGGVFGRVQGGALNLTGNGQTLRNDGAVRSNKDCAGGIVGALQVGSIGNGTNNGTVTADGENAGGLAGFAAAGTTVSSGKNNANANITAKKYAGGAVGRNSGTVTSLTDFVGGAFTVTANEEAVGGIVGFNDGGTVVSLTVNNMGNIKLAGTAPVAGGVVGANTGTVKDCVIQAVASLVSLTADGKTLGGVVGDNRSGSSTVQNIELKYASLTAFGSGRVDALGGIVGSNSCMVMDSKLTGTFVLTADGYHTPATPTTAETNSAIGGLVGINQAGATLKDSLIALDANSANKITVKFGCVGGIAGTNAGTMRDCGSDKTADFTNYLKTVLPQPGTTLTDVELDAKRDELVTKLTGDTWAQPYINLRGTDLVTNSAGVNQLVITQTGAGNLGGVAGHNSGSAVMTDCASGNWFVYGNNVSVISHVGGVIGLNEQTIGTTGLVNCAAVRRFTDDVATTTVDTDTDANAANGYTPNVYVGGVIGYQNVTVPNDAPDSWTLKNTLNYGSVMNSGADNVGGVMGSWLQSGGTAQDCYNFGNLAVNAADATGVTVGRAGGIAAYLELAADAKTATLVHCQNHGSILGAPGSTPFRGAGAVGGIIGDAVATTTDPVNLPTSLKLELVNCVNGPTAKMESMQYVAGMVGVLGSSNANLTFDRCRNYSTMMTTTDTTAINAKVAGIMGLRQEANSAVTMANCFALYQNDTGKEASPLVFRADTETDATLVTGTENYYMDATSHSYTDLDSMNRTDPGGPETTGGLPTPAETAATIKVDGHRLYAGKDLGANPTTDVDNMHVYFGMRVDDAFQVSDINNTWAYVKATAFADPTVTREMVAGAGAGNHAGASLGKLLLLFDEKETGWPEPAWTTGAKHDVTDADVRRYYTNALDTLALAAPLSLMVQRNEAVQAFALMAEDGEAAPAQTAQDVGFGTYHIGWQSAADTGVSSYTVQLWIDTDGDDEPDTVALTQNVYSTEMDVAVQEGWLGCAFRVTVCANNSRGAGEVATSAVMHFAKPMEDPQVELQMVREGETQYYQVAVANAAAYDEAIPAKDWAVDVLLQNALGVVLNSFTLTSTAPAAPIGINTENDGASLVALAMPGTVSGESWYDSQVVTTAVYLPEAYPAGTISVADFAMEGTADTALAVRANLTYTGGKHPPLYRAAITGVCDGEIKLAGDAGGEASLQGQRVTLAWQELRLENDTAQAITFNLSAEQLAGYGNLSLAVWPVDAGVGPVRMGAKISLNDTIAAIADGTNLFEQGYELSADENGALVCYRWAPLVGMVAQQQTDHWTWQSLTTDPEVEIPQSQPQAVAPTVPVVPAVTPETPTPETPTPETPTPETPTPETPTPETPTPETPTPETPTPETPTPDTPTPETPTPETPIPEPPTPENPTPETPVP